MNYKNLPKDILIQVLDYDGRIKYKNGKYVNIIHKNDNRYELIKPLINKKKGNLKKYRYR
jgi:hypothetical protein